MNQYTTGWSPEDIAELIRLNGEGMLPNAIAKALGRSHKAVNAKRWTLGLHIAPSAVRAARSKPKARSSRVAVPPAPPAPVIDFPIRGLTIADAEFGGCRWAVGGDGYLTRFCCRPRTRGAFCREHATVAYKPRKQTEEERDNERQLLKMLRRMA